MRMLPMIVTLALGIALAAPAVAQFRFSARIGSGGGGVVKPHGGAPWVKRRAEKRPERRRHDGIFLFGRHFHGHHRHRDRHVERAPAPVEPRPVPIPILPVPPVAAAPTEPPPPPDPHGPLWLIPARGIVPAEAPYRLGEALPPGLPHVTLAWRQFDLPEPPPGRLYARVGRDVLLITAAGRIVESVLPPG
jgi:Ni/Co efflux regulator RcnB